MTDIAAFIDHTLLRPDAAEGDVARLCDEAREHSFHAVCLHPSFVKTAAGLLVNSGIKIAAVIGFPLGLTLRRVKTFEAIESVLSGADELDLVINIGRAKANDWEAVEREISDIVSATGDAVRKIIIETCYLSNEEKEKACAAAINGGAEFIKTSTGFGPSGATLEDVRLIRSCTGGGTGIKAAGGIKTLARAMAMIEAGATRIGTSSGVAIMQEAGM